jgi:hypothetical protein
VPVDARTPVECLKAIVGDHKDEHCEKLCARMVPLKKQNDAKDQGIECAKENQDIEPVKC